MFYGWGCLHSSYKKGLHMWHEPFIFSTDFLCHVATKILNLNVICWATRKIEQNVKVKYPFPLTKS